MKKRCFKCKKVKEIDQFYVHKMMADGHLNKCKGCAKKDGATRYADPESREYIREYERKRFNDPKRRKKLVLYLKKMRQNNPEKNKARRLVAQGLRDGSVVRRPCVRCGGEQAQAHHPDYTKPLKVVWLCFKHHRELHGQIVGKIN